MFENIDEEYRGSLIACIECVKKYHANYLSSSVLILSFIHYEDSLFNEVCPDISFDDVFDLIINEKEKEEDLQEVLEEAKDIAKSNGGNIIFDEYLFYGCLKLDCNARKLLVKMNVDLDKIKVDICEYITNDNTFLTNLTKLAIENKLSPFIGRDYYITKIIRILSKKQKNNCMLIGSAGVGKSALVEGLALELYKRKSNIIIYRLDLGVIIAGTRYRGDLEERLVEVINQIKESNAVLFIDEIHTIVSSGNSEGSLDIANILKPVLARNEIKCIGATTTDEYYKYIEKDKALERRFEKIFIKEANKEETYEILKGISYKFEEFYGLKYSDKILREIVEDCKFFPNRRYPDKAIDIMDEVGSYVKETKRVHIKSNDVKKIIFENMGIINMNTLVKTLNFEELRKYYELFFLGMDARETICNVAVYDVYLEYLLADLENVFLINKESVIYVDVYNERHLEKLIEHIIKNPIAIIVIKYEKNIVMEFINEFVNRGKNRKISLKNCVVIFTLESKNNALTQQIGYFAGEFCENIENKFLDEVLTYKVSCRKRIENFMIEMKKNHYNLIVDSLIEDYDFDKVIEVVVRNLEQKDMCIYKNANNEISIKYH